MSTTLMLLILPMGSTSNISLEVNCPTAPRVRAHIIRKNLYQSTVFNSKKKKYRLRGV
eukprot:TRINITY_DN1490_c0_g1_i1.p1 TRINITY_DN1490_c0_g1~~TRINITY_DN1490_c0_g1_i1.p1  ORF type:complete len:58 (+),score=2.71 TRINITY_DN1490_c0_g1_i1:116-289(+)